MKRKKDFLTNHNNLNDNELTNITGGSWKWIGGALLWIAQDAFSHTDQISSGWKSAGKKTFF